MERPVFARIREACARVAERSRHVRIASERVSAYALSLPVEGAGPPEIDPSVHYLGQGDDTVGFLLTLDSVNFGSGYFPHLSKRPGMSGYFTVASRLTDHYRAHGPFTPEQLSRIGAEECARIFHQDPGNDVAFELMGLFARAWNDLGTCVTQRSGGSFRRLVDTAGGSAARLVDALSGMAFFRDVETYDGLSVPFYKRAQITAADLALAFGGKGPGRFEDLDQLTIFADNLVPHVLRMDGVLVYDEALAAKIDREELIPLGSREEVEIRACAVHAVERLVEELRGAGRRVTAMQLDNLLWHRGQGPRYKKTKPRHRTRTVYY